MPTKDKPKSSRPRSGCKCPTWDDLVTTKLVQLGGRACLKEINDAIAGHVKCRTNPTWQATIRRIVRHSKNIVPVRPKQRTGIYRLVTYVQPKTKR